MKPARRYVAPISIAILILVAGVTYATLRTTITSPPPILDPNFELWVENSGQSRPLIWQFQNVTSPNDFVTLNQTTINGMNATQLQILKSNHTGWTYAYLSQSIDGPRLTALFTMDIAIWVMKDTQVPQTALFGVEVNDGVHVLTFIFSDQAAEPQQFLAHRTVFIQTPGNTWVKRPVDFAGEYRAAKWGRPDHVTLSVVFGAGPGAVGSQSVYIHGFSVSQPKSLGYFFGVFACREVNI